MHSHLLISANKLLWWKPEAIFSEIEFVWGLFHQERTSETQTSLSGQTCFYTNTRRKNNQKGEMKEKVGPYSTQEDWQTSKTIFSLDPPPHA